MSDELRRLKAQQEANSAAIARMNMMLQAQNARRNTQNDDDDDEVDQGQQQQGQQQWHQGTAQPITQNGQYQTANPDQLILQAIADRAAQTAAQQVHQDLNANNDIKTKIESRMKRLVSDYPALQQEDSDLIIKSRDIYARISSENPSLDEATKYELAVREAASAIGARPVNAPIEDYAASDFVMPVGRNPAVSTRTSGKNRLTPNIVNFAKAMSINVDPKNVEGKRNLEELNEFTSRFNADQDESAYKYR